MRLADRIPHLDNITGAVTSTNGGVGKAANTSITVLRPVDGGVTAAAIPKLSLFALTVLLDDDNLVGTCRRRMASLLF